MGIDNVLGVAGAAKGAFDLVVLGLLISIPIVVFGSQIVLKLVQRWPIIIQAGAAVLAYTAAHMIVGEPWLKPYLGGAETAQQALRGAVYVVCIVGVLGAGWWSTRRRRARQDQTEDALP